MRAQAVVFANSESLTLLGNMLRQRNEFSEAGPFLRQGIAMKQQLHDTASPQYALNLLQLGLESMV